MERFALLRPTPSLARRADGSSWSASWRTAVWSTLLALFLAVAPAAAQTVWTDWSSATPGGPGTAVGSLGPVAVTFSGQVLSATTTGGQANWSPDATWVGGAVNVAPSTINDMVRQNGGFAGPNTITFSTPVRNLVIAIWSLGSGGVPVSWTFDATPHRQAGGPNAFFGGQPIAVAGHVVTGSEGNGTIMFAGSYSSLSWTSTGFENDYGFTVGTADATPVPSLSTGAQLLLVMLLCAAAAATKSSFAVVQA